MKRINIYIDEKDDSTIDHLVTLTGSNRSDVIRQSITEYAAKYDKYLNEFSEDLSTPKELSLDIWNKYKSNPIEFIENIKLNDRNNQHIKLYEYQKKLIEKLSTYNALIVNNTRQIGCSVINIALIAHTALTVPNSTIAIISNRLDTAIHSGRICREILDSATEICNAVPKVTNSNKRKLILSNGSSISIITNTMAEMQSQEFSYIFIDNFASWDSIVANIFVKDVLPVYMKHIDNQYNKLTKLIITSSAPKKANHFTKLWVDAVTNFNNLHPVCISHKTVAEELGRDEIWVENTIAHVGQDVFNTEFFCETDIIGSTELCEDAR